MQRPLKHHNFAVLLIKLGPGWIEEYVRLTDSNWYMAL